MEESRMIEEVPPPGCCAIWNVSGRRIATPFAPPSPGSTPMITPRMIPASISRMLNHDSATAKPPINDWSSCIAAPLVEPEGGLERTLGQRDAEPDLEHHEEGEIRSDRDGDDLRPRVLREVAHEER